MAVDNIARGMAASALKNQGGGGSSLPIVNTAAIGQTIRVAAVDDAGKPTEWEAVEFPAGGLAEFEYIDTIDFSTEEMGSDSSGKDYTLHGVTEVVLIWKDMGNESSTASYVRLAFEATSLYNVAARIAKSGAKTNGYTHIRVLEGVGTSVWLAPGAISAENYTASTGGGYTYNLLPKLDKITKMSIVNSGQEYFATKGTIDVYVR